MDKIPKDSLVGEEKDPLIRKLNRLVIYVVKALAVMIVIVMFWGLIDVVVHMVQQFLLPPIGRFEAEGLLTILGSFLAVLIVIEIFINIVFYLKRDAVHVPLVLATALTAVARKVIIMDYNVVSPWVMYGIAALIFSIGLVFWLVTRREKS